MKKDSLKIYIKKVRSDKSDFYFSIDTNFGSYTGGMYHPSKKESLPGILKSVFDSCIQHFEPQDKSYFFRNFTVVFNIENRIEGNAEYSFREHKESTGGYHTFSMINDSVWQTVPMSQEEINLFSEAFVVLRNPIEVGKLKR